MNARRINPSNRRPAAGLFPAGSTASALLMRAVVGTALVLLVSLPVRTVGSELAADLSAQALTQGEALQLAGQDEGRPAADMPDAQPQPAAPAAVELPALAPELASKLGPALSRVVRTHKAGLPVSTSQGPCFEDADGQVRAHVFVRVQAGSAAAAQDVIQDAGGAVGTALSTVLTASVPIARIDEVAMSDDVVQLEAAHRLASTLDVSVPEIRADLVHAGPEGFPCAYQGNGVIVGIVDSGIDWAHDDFRNPDGSSRILYVWDQTDAGGLAPSEFAYGTQWAKMQLDDELDGTPTGLVREVDDDGHGTHVAGIAAGNGRAAGGYTGVAPEAELVIVKTDLWTDSIIDGINYIFQKAQAEGKAAVVNISLGSNYGPHDNTSAYETALNALTGPGRVISMAAGNAGDNHVPANEVPLAQHFQDAASSTEQCFVFRPYASASTFCTDIWYETGTIQFKVLVNVLVGSSLYYCGETNWVSPGDEYHNWIQDSGYNVVYLDIDATKIWDPGNGDREVTICGTRGPLYPGEPWSDYFMIILYRGYGTFDAWNVHFADGFYSNQISGCEYADNEMTVSAGATAAEVIAVGSYVTKPRGDSPTVGDISDFSANGPSRNPAATGLKPEIAAPGEIIMSVKSFDALGVPFFFTVDPSGTHGTLRGTSMSAPHVTGAVALMLQRNSILTPDDCETIAATSARTDAFTGGVHNDVWGYGKLDVLGAITHTPVRCDFDADLDVDLTDFGLFQSCFNGPNRAPQQPTFCWPADLDDDGDVDLTDFGIFSGCFNGPNRPPACCK